MNEHQRIKKCSRLNWHTANNTPTFTEGHLETMWLEELPPKASVEAHVKH